MASTGASADLLVVGLGATEQHGPHLPLDTDTVIADALCRGPRVRGAGAARAGACRTARAASTRVSPGPCRSARRRSRARAGRARPVATTGRCCSCARTAGTRSRSRAALRAGRERPRVVPALGRRRPRRPHRDVADARAGARRASARSARRATPRRSSSLLPRLRAEGVRAVSANGVLGDAAGASAEEGRALLAAAIADLVAFVDAWDLRRLRRSVAAAAARLNPPRRPCA